MLPFAAPLELPETLTASEFLFCYYKDMDAKSPLFWMCGFLGASFGELILMIVGCGKNEFFSLELPFMIFISLGRWIWNS
jgi:hypothetical protein